MAAFARTVTAPMALGLALAVVLCAPATAASGKPAGPDRTVLPIAEPQHAPQTEVDARKAKAPPRFEITAPKGAPNVVIVLLDDMGYGHPSTFGGAIAMPTLDRLATEGLRYGNFHVTALCSPTRAALLTGRNHHTNNTGAVQDVATAFPGYTGVRPNSVAPLAEMLRHNGYNTAAFGKWHLTPLWETSISGPYTTWPTGSGFEKFYGFLGGETNQWAPLLYDGVAKVELPGDPNYHFTTDMTNQAIAWMRFQQTMTPQRPFFVYFAPGATHAPHHVPKQWADRYKGRFDAGWDKYREEALARQIKLGIVPPGTRLARKPDAVKDWDGLSSDEKRLFARQMEVYAGFAEHTDHEVGRLVKAIDDLGVADNTLIFYIAGDNGASGEGGLTGTSNEMTYFNAVQESLGDQLERIGQWGGPHTYPHFALGWAVAGNTPFAFTKQVGGDYGGSTNGMVVRWPKGVKAPGGTRSQFVHAIDVAPTVLEAAGLPFPKRVNGVAQKPFEGTSFRYTFNDPRARDRHTTQYFEIAGSRAIYHDGWLARAIHRVPWEPEPRSTFDKDVWQLYDTRNDFGLANDVAAAHPARLKEMQALFLQEAKRYSVLPLDDRSVERMDPILAGRPDLMGDRTSLTLYPGMTGMMENTFINVKNRSSRIAAEIEVPPEGASGVVVAQGGRFGGWSLYLKDGRPTFVYNFVGLERFVVAASERLPAGRATVEVNIAYDGGGRGKGATATLSVDGKRVAEGRIDRTTAGVFSLDEGADVGVDEDTPVSEDYVAGLKSRFTGRIEKVVVEVR